MITNTLAQSTNVRILQFRMLVETIKCITNTSTVNKVLNDIIYTSNVERGLAESTLR